MFEIKKIGIEEVDDTTKLLIELDWLPLLISQAAAYTEDRDGDQGILVEVAEGKRRWKTLKESHFDRHRRQHVSNSILETWRISIEHIRQENGNGISDSTHPRICRQSEHSV